MGEPNPAHDQRSNSEVEASRQKMREVMNKLAANRRELGVLSIGVDPNDPDKRVDIFIAPVNAIEDKSLGDGGDSDVVVATTEGFFAIRHFHNSSQGRNEASNLQNNLLSMWAGTADKTMKVERLVFGRADKVSFARDNRGQLLEFDIRGVFGGSYKFSENGYVNDRGVYFSRLVLAGKDTVDRAFDASKEKARELKMPDAKSVIRTIDTNAAADSILGRLKNS